MEWLPALVAYLIALVIFTLMKRRELASDPQKAQRYRVLPLHYKLACWCGVLPLMIPVPMILWAVLESPVLAGVVPFIGMAAYAALEVACVPVYKRHGLWN